MPPIPILFVIATLALLVWSFGDNSTLTRKRLKRLLVFGVIVAILYVLVRVGLPGLAAAGAGLLALARVLGPLVLRLLPLLLTHRRRAESGSAKANEANAAPPSVQLTRSEAFQVLGLNENATDAEIRNAYRALIKKVHPDRGGTPYLASRVNLAKDLLLPKDKKGQ